MEIALASRAGNRFRAFLGAALVGLLELLWLLLLLGFVLDRPLDSVLALAVVVPILLVLAVVTGAFFLNLLRELFLRSPRLLVESGRLVVQNRALLKRPVVIERGDVVAVAIRAADGESWWGEDAPAVLETLVGEGLDRPQVFDEPGTPEGIHAAILDELTFTLVPVVTHDPTDRPNVALHLRRPFDFRAHRRFGTRAALGGRGSSAAAAKPGLLLSARDPGAARDVFRTWGLEGKLGMDQVELLRPAPEDLKRFRRRRLLRIVALVYGAAVFLETIFDAAGD